MTLMNRELVKQSGQKLPKLRLQRIRLKRGVPQDNAIVAENTSPRPTPTHHPLGKE